MRSDPPEGVRVVVDEEDLTCLEGLIQGPGKSALIPSDMGTALALSFSSVRLGGTAEVERKWYGGILYVYWPKDDVSHMIKWRVIWNLRT